MAFSLAVLRARVGLFKIPKQALKILHLALPGLLPDRFVDFESAHLDLGRFLSA